MRKAQTYELMARRPAPSECQITPRERSPLDRKLIAGGWVGNNASKIQGVGTASIGLAQRIFDGTADSFVYHPTPDYDQMYKTR